ncbi:MAG: ABC transporter ATP-binding protein/permease [Acidimicrobiia bacterium]|nr:ABC transporter ATP-binding protein/permease [Acidimicrobiia bacterium]
MKDDRTLIVKDDRTLRVLRRALQEAPVLRRGLGVTVFLAAIGTAIQVIVPVVMQQIIDDELLTPAEIDLGSIGRKVMLAALALVLGTWVGRTALIRLVRASSTGLSDLRQMTFAHLMRRSVLHVDAERRGSLVSRVTSDIATLQGFMDWGGVGLLTSGSQVLLALTAMYVYQWQLAALVTVGIVLYTTLMVWFQRILQRSYDRVRRRVANSLAVLSEAISALPIVRAYGVERGTKARVAEALEDRFQSEYRTMRFGNILFSSAELFAGVLMAAVVAAGLAVGTTPGRLLAFLFLVNLLTEPVQMVVEVLETAQSAASGMRRILGEIDSEVEIPDPVDGKPLPPGALDVVFDEVSFRYGDGPEVLNDVGASVAPGSRVAVVGETGSGKTTFAKLAVRLLERNSGIIAIGGVPLEQIEFTGLRSRVAFVPQEGFLFEGTISDNIRYGKPGASDREIRTAFMELGLDEWLDRLPDGISSHVGERGGNLSAGERQLVALVRAWISTPDLLVLDEATSAVDPALDVQLRRAMERLTAGRTAVTIAHRLATAEASDDILVFDQGRLAERGTHSALLAANGVYAALHADWVTGTKSV